MFRGLVVGGSGDCSVIEGALYEDIHVGKGSGICKYASG